MAEPLVHHIDVAAGEQTSAHYASQPAARRGKTRAHSSSFPGANERAWLKKQLARQIPSATVSLAPSKARKERLSE